MKKKSTLIICTCVVLVAVLAIGGFLFKTRDMQGGGTDDFARFVGTWQIISHNPDPTNSESPFLLVEGQFITFDDTTLRYYVDGACVLTAEYTFEDSHIKLTNADTALEDFPQEFVLEQIAGSTDYIKLIDEIVIRDWQLVRHAGSAEAPVSVEDAFLDGKWNVVVHGTNQVTDEQIVFDPASSMMTDYRPSGEISLSYTWVGENRVVFQDFGEFVLCNVAQDCLAMIQLDNNGNVWMLERAE